MCSFFLDFKVMKNIRNILCENKSKWIQSDIIKQVLKQVCVSQVKGDILDIGCGNGKFTSELANECNRFGKKVIGVDKDPDCQRDFKLNARGKNMEFYNIDCKHPKALQFYLKNTFSFIFLDACYDGLEPVLDNLYRSLSIGGVIVVDDTNEPVVSKAIEKYKKIDIDNKWQRGKCSLKPNATRHKEFQIIYK